jgi:uncharacterized protein
MRTITLEEHFVSREFLDRAGIDMGGQTRVAMTEEITDLAELRLKAMDESGIDVQVISHVWPTLAAVPADDQIAICTSANDQLAAAVTAHPDRFAGFAALPLADPSAAVRELDRAVGDLGFRGALINGRADADRRFLDDPSLFPVLQRAEALGVPLYLHPGAPTETVRREYYDGFGPSVRWLLGTAAWGWHAEAGLHVLRMIVARVFDRLPGLKVIIGHDGEMLPFMLDRTDELLTPAARQDTGLVKGVADTFHSNVWVTTSGMFSLATFQLIHQVVGADRILFSVDYPLSPNSRGRAFLDAVPIAPADKEKISHRNAELLLRLPAA